MKLGNKVQADLKGCGFSRTAKSQKSAKSLSRQAQRLKPWVETLAARLTTRPFKAVWFIDWQLQVSVSHIKQTESRKPVFLQQTLVYVLLL